MRSGQRGRADGATLDCLRPGALRPDGERVSIARPTAVRALRPEGAPIAPQTTFRGPARAQSGGRGPSAASAQSARAQEAHGASPAGRGKEFTSPTR